MPTGPAPTADEIAVTIRSLIDRVSDAKLTHEMARRGQEAAGIVAEVERQQIVDEGALARAGWTVNEQRATGAAMLDRLLRHASRDRLPEAQKARRRHGLDHRSSIGSSPAASASSVADS